MNVDECKALGGTWSGNTCVITKEVFKTDRATVGKLVGSIFIDLIGWCSYGIPLLGEFIDIIWAPISALLVYAMYGKIGFSALNFIEELLPGTDFIPTATITWFYVKSKEK